MALIDASAKQIAAELMRNVTVARIEAALGNYAERARAEERQRCHKIAMAEACRHMKAEKIYADKSFADGHLASQQCKAAALSIAGRIKRDG